jgi:hypothetical protein
MPGTWTSIGSQAYSSLLAGAFSLFFIDSQQNPHEYLSGSGTWVQVGTPGREFVVNLNGLYGETPDGVAKIYGRADGGNWSLVKDLPSSVMYAGAHSLIVTEQGTLNLSLYGGSVDSFTSLCGPSKQVVIDSDDVVYRLIASGDISQIAPGAETKIGAAANRLYVAGRTLYAFDATRRVLTIYGGTPSVWSDVPSPP